MGNVIHGRGYVYILQYHIVWCVKYRRKVLTGDVEKDLFQILHKIAKDNSFTIAEMNGEADHVHLLVECSPQNYIPDMLKALKGVSARRLFEKHPELKSKLWDGHLWDRSYFSATVSENTEEQVRDYIRSQKEKQVMGC